MLSTIFSKKTFSLLIFVTAILLACDFNAFAFSHDFFFFKILTGSSPPVRMLTAGSAPPPSVMRRMESELGILPLASYGLTEVRVGLRFASLRNENPKMGFWCHDPLLLSWSIALVVSSDSGDVGAWLQMVNGSDIYTQLIVLIPTKNRKTAHARLYDVLENGHAALAISDFNWRWIVQLSPTIGGLTYYGKWHSREWRLDHFAFLLWSRLSISMRRHLLESQ